MPHLAEVFERLTQMKIDDRHPWCGKLVFAAFSGSHQMLYLRECITE